MKIYLEEKIGNPDLFTGRKKELADLLSWIDKIKNKTSQSLAILSRRKTGKSALLQRLYNICFGRSDGVLPFYYEIKESPQWAVDLAGDFFLSFLSQYIAFKKSKPEYLSIHAVKSFENAVSAVRNEKLEYLADLVENVRRLAEKENVGLLWDAAREAPRMVAEYCDDRIVQIIDEFQFLNRFVYLDKYQRHRAEDFAGSYLHTCEYKNAPLLVAGSWVGWLMDDLNRLLPGRFQKMHLKPLPEDECIEMVLKYSHIEKVPVTEETTHLIACLTEGNPFYISALMRSRHEDKDLATEKGVRSALDFETLYPDGQIHSTWMEYIDAAFPRINEKHAKNIVLYLSKHRRRPVSRKELKEKLGIQMSDPEFERKLMAINRTDLVDRDKRGFRGVQDNIFDKVFRSVYSDDIDRFLTREAPEEYKALFEDIRKKYLALSGEFNRYKGAFAEFVIVQRLKWEAFRDNDRFASTISNLPEDFAFARYERVWSYNTPPLFMPEFQIDIFAKAPDDAYCLVCEVKCRKAKFTAKEAAAFLEKANALQSLESLKKFVPIVFSIGGFQKTTLRFMEKNGIAWSDDERWGNR